MHVSCGKLLRHANDLEAHLTFCQEGDQRQRCHQTSEVQIAGTCGMGAFPSLGCKGAAGFSICRHASLLTLMAGLIAELYAMQHEQMRQHLRPSSAQVQHLGERIMLKAGCIAMLHSLTAVLARCCAT